MDWQKNYKIILIFIFFIPHILFANKVDTTFIVREKKINKYAQKIANTRFDEKLSDTLSKELLNYFVSVLEKQNSLDYPFDSLKGIGKVESKNKKLRIFTWNIIRNDGTYIYYGILQNYNKEKKQSQLFILSDASDNIKNPENASLSEKQWFGALYYQMVENKLPNRKVLYTLIGWDGNNLYTSKKVIESLYFTESGKPKFGKSVFQIGKKKQKRVIFEYSRMASMMIDYKENMKMIVFDHLSPSESKYEGNPAFYGPDYSFDGFEFKNEIWNYKSEVPYEVAPKRQ